ERLEEGTLDGGCRARVRACRAQSFEGDAHAHGIDAGEVVVGPHGQRHAPVTGGAVRIELRRLRERAGRLVVVEGPQQAHALIEVRLGWRGAAADGAMELPEALEELRALRPRLNAGGGGRVVR